MKQEISFEDLAKKYSKISPFNISGDDQRFIACVGRNGGYDQSTIYDGFIDATRTLIESLKDYKNFADPIVYPVLFSFRHSVELALKGIYGQLKYIETVKKHDSAFRKLVKLNKIFFRLSRQLEDGIGNTKLKKKRVTCLESKIKILDEQVFSNFLQEEYTHDINILIDKITALYHIDSQIRGTFDSVLIILAHYKDLDPKGDFFRYWLDKNAIPHFESKNISLVRIDIIYAHLNILENYFRQIEFEIWRIRKEYQTGTFTKQLSRQQIEKVSKMIPSKANFRREIKTAKAKIQEIYSMGSRKFDEVLGIIKKHREFSLNMGTEHVFLNLSDDSIRIFVKSALGLCEWELEAKAITQGELAIFITFSEISGWRQQESSYAYFSEDLRYLYYERKRRSPSCFDIKPPAEIRPVIRGMKKCGQKTYVDMIECCIEEHRGYMRKRLIDTIKQISLLASNDIDEV